MQNRNRRGVPRPGLAQALNHDTDRQEKSPDDFPYEGEDVQASLSNEQQLPDQTPFVRVDNPDDFE
jgi:hypothetical protein